jgi:hypothetical protein
VIKARITDALSETTAIRFAVSHSGRITPAIAANVVAPFGTGQFQEIQTTKDEISLVDVRNDHCEKMPLINCQRISNNRIHSPIRAIFHECYRVLAKLDNVTPVTGAWSSKPKPASLAGLR